eukprot:TRINITY_DN5834_c1_g1_i1.p1 TRINITY_DN5834_c1_g1~~TRINITY_DN5834_c1_g1_i1.p1  ORF type:complete len:615 (+),score=100.92 TRINITY_DN5834_c1_g1_i1:76-1845(+)
MPWLSLLALRMTMLPISAAYNTSTLGDDGGSSHVHQTIVSGDERAPSSKLQSASNSAVLISGDHAQISIKYDGTKAERPMERAHVDLVFNGKIAPSAPVVTPDQNPFMARPSSERLSSEIEEEERRHETTFTETSKPPEGVKEEPKKEGVKEEGVKEEGEKKEEKKEEPKDGKHGTGKNGTNMEYDVPGDDPEDDGPGDPSIHIAGYENITVVHEGSTTTCSALDQGDKKVFLKLLNAQDTFDPDHQDMLSQECKMLQKFHEDDANLAVHFVKCLENGVKERNAIQYIAMENAGEPVLDYINKSTDRAATALMVAGQLLDAELLLLKFNASHGHIIPSNVFVVDNGSPSSASSASPVQDDDDFGGDDAPPKKKRSVLSKNFHPSNDQGSSSLFEKLESMFESPGEEHGHAVQKPDGKDKDTGANGPVVKLIDFDYLRTSRPYYADDVVSIGYTVFAIACGEGKGEELKAGLTGSEEQNKKKIVELCGDTKISQELLFVLVKTLSYDLNTIDDKDVDHVADGVKKGDKMELPGGGNNGTNATGAEKKPEGGAPPAEGGAKPAEAKPAEGTKTPAEEAKPAEGTAAEGTKS